MKNIIENNRPFLKWVGGKYRILDKLKNEFSKESIERYIEPFLGAGSIALNVNYPQIIVNDVNPDLISVWQMLKNMKEDFIKECKKLFIQENNTENRYYELRNEFNKTNNILRKSTLFVYLNRHCFNGICRYNSKGDFNTPIGEYEIVHFPQQEFNAALKHIEKFEIYNKDFREIFKIVNKNDLIYCDPPYLPISQSSNFNAYTKENFLLKDHLDLAECAKQAAEKGAMVIISNHYNWYSKQIYTCLYESRILKINVSRTVSSKIDKRKEVEEIIAIFRKR